MCSPHTRPAPTLCTPKGECTPFASSHCRGRARRPTRRLPLSRACRVRRTRSSSPSVRSDSGCSLDVALPRCTGSGPLPPADKGRGKPKTEAAVRRPDPVCPVCPLVLLPPCVNADSAHVGCPTVHCVEARPNQRHAIGCAALAGARNAQSTLPWLIDQLSAGPRSIYLSIYIYIYLSIYI